MAGTIYDIHEDLNGDHTSWELFKDRFSRDWDVTHLDFEEVIDLTDFSWERHEVTTDDGYINTLYRIYQDSPENKPAVFFQHGFVASSDDFVIAPPGQGPAFVAAEAGYDVWLGNSRGNRYSLKHETLNSYVNTSYWEHSFAEIGQYDLPAFLSFITEETEN